MPGSWPPASVLLLLSVASFLVPADPLDPDVRLKTCTSRTQGPRAHLSSWEGPKSLWVPLRLADPHDVSPISRTPLRLPRSHAPGPHRTHQATRRWPRRGSPRRAL